MPIIIRVFILFTLISSLSSLFFHSFIRALTLGRSGATWLWTARLPSQPLQRAHGSMVKVIPLEIYSTGNLVPVISEPAAVANTPQHLVVAQTDGLVSVFCC